SRLRSPDNWFKTTSFVSPTSGLTINLGIGDTVNVNSLDSLYRAALTLSDGGVGNNVVNLNAPLILGTASAAGNLGVTAAAVNVNAPITTSSGGVFFGGSVTITNSGPLTIAPGANIAAAGPVVQNGPWGVTLGANINSPTQVGF